MHTGQSGEDFRHSGLDPESSYAASNGSNGLYRNGPATWIAACAGMTALE
jgi:hypothetical protein